MNATNDTVPTMGTPGMIRPDMSAQAAQPSFGTIRIEAGPATVNIHVAYDADPRETRNTFDKVVGQARMLLDAMQEHYDLSHPLVQQYTFPSMGHADVHPGGGVGGTGGRG